MLRLLQLLPPINCSGILYTVNQCSMNQITVIQMHFHCTFNAIICSVLQEMEQVFGHTHARTEEEEGQTDVEVELVI